MFTKKSIFNYILVLFTIILLTISSKANCLRKEPPNLSKNVKFQRKDTCKEASGSYLNLFKSDNRIVPIVIFFIEIVLFNLLAGLTDEFLYLCYFYQSL